MTTGKKWIITVSGDQSLHEVQKQLKQKGFKVEQVFDQIGCIMGSASEEVVGQLRMVPGVDDVSPDTSIDIGPPDAPVTW